MVDVHNKKQRSYNMSQIRNRNTKPEILLRKELFSRGMRGYRVSHKLIGKPDITYTQLKIAIFVDGCFWHKCHKCFVSPKTNKSFWISKIKGNIKRDKYINRRLKDEGWTVIRLWEHDVKKDLDKCVKKIKIHLREK